MAARITAVINTLNEERNIGYAIGSVRSWVDEIVVVDMHSDDRTAEIARELGARVVLHERTPAIDGARAFAVAQAKGDWVLVLDADEMVPSPLSAELRSIAEAGAADVVVIPWLNHLLGSPLLHTGWGPRQDAHPRFFRAGSLLATDAIHDYLAPAPGARVLRLSYRPGHAVEHFAYVDGTHFLEKLNRYTSVEALQAHRAGQRAHAGRAMLDALREFVRRYLRARGFRDGWRGFYLSLFMAFYRLATHAKLRELEATGGASAVQARYGERRAELLAVYEVDAPDRGASGMPAGHLSS